MRITNTMMTNTTMRNVNKSKNNLYTTEQQMSSQKKISKPSDDPIIAIRALSLRTSLTEVEQYLKKNVPDAGAWLTLTETSLNNMDGIYKDIIKYCTQGSTDSYETTNRSAIIQSIQQLRDAMYAEGNADSSGRYIFTGYRTDRALTFQNDAEVAGLSYRIKQSFKGSDFTTTKYMKNGVDINKIASIKASDTPETQEVYRIRLAYGGCAYDAADAASLPQITVDGQAYAGTRLRQLFGLNSTRFSLRYADGVFRFDVRGYGHRVGMSQYGANVMAIRGSGYADILAHYYPGTALIRAEG